MAANTIIPVAVEKPSISVNIWLIVAVASSLPWDLSDCVPQNAWS